MEPRDRRILWLFIAVWTLVNVVQGIFTSLAHDEAYYWVWSRFPDWGYVEHPPMVAMFIRVGYAVFQSELGVRLLTILSSSIVLYLLYVRLIRRDIWLYIAIVSSVFAVHVGGFLTAPDSPLFFFTFMFYLVLREYIDKNNLVSTLLMILVITGMMYSKYHGALVIILALLLDVQILRRKSFWFVGIVCLAFYIPHVLWLLENGESGLGYALSDRFQDLAKPHIVGGYILGQIGILGPIMGFFLVMGAILAKPSSHYQKTLKRVALGLLLFFFAWSFIGRIEANWTASAVVPLIILCHQYFSERTRWRKAIFYLAVPSILVIVSFRVALIFDIPLVTNNIDRFNEFHGWEEFSDMVMEEADGRPVLISGYQGASKLWFYSGNRALPINNNDRPNQFYLYDFEDQIKSQDVLIINNYQYGDWHTIPSPSGEIKVGGYNSFLSYQDVRIEITEKEIQATAGKPIEVYARITAPEGFVVPKSESVPNDPFLGFRIYDEDGKVALNIFKKEIPHSISHSAEVPMSFNAPASPGIYDLRVQLHTDSMLLWKVSQSCKLIVE